MSTYACLPAGYTTDAVFRYDELEPGHTRLGMISYTDHGLTFTMKHYDMRHLPSYQALSYVWNTQPAEAPRQIQCATSISTGSMKVTSNLYAALEAICAYETGYWWIDALCINQLSDPAEKSAQVQIMHLIYKKADNVMVWLYGKDTNTAKTLALCGVLADGIDYDHQPAKTPQENDLSGFLAVLRTNRDVLLTSRSFSNHDLPAYESTVWYDFSDLFANEWLSRIWTFQEVMLAEHVTVRSGAVMIMWKSFYEVGMRLSSTQLLFHPDVLRSRGDERRLTRLRSFMEPAQHGKFFWLYVSEARHKQVTEPADRIYGLLSLASEELRKEIPIDYSPTALQDYHRTYKLATKAMMKHFGVAHILQMVDTAQIDQTLPSWCPHYDRVSQGHGAVWCDGRAGLYTQDTQQIYDISSDDSTICVGAFIIDRIKTVLEHSDWRSLSSHEQAIHFTRWLSAIEAAIRPYCADESQTQLWLAQCMLNYVPGASDNTRMVAETFPAKPAQSFHAIRLRWKEMSEGVDPEDSVLTKEDHALLQAVNTHLAKVWTKRVFFITENGHFGIAARGVHCTDELCLPIAAHHFAILRRRSQAVHSYVSMAYVHHNMLGEMLKDRPQDSCEMLTIV